MIRYLNFHYIGPPYVIPSNEQFTFAITRNNSVTISVSITAVPPVNPSNIQWYFQSALDELVELLNNTIKYTFSADRQSLTISDVQISDVGTYRITAENIAGANETDVTLVVYGMFILLYKYFEATINCPIYKSYKELDSTINTNFYQ